MTGSDMKFTLDWNCVIEVEEQQAQAASVEALVNAHRRGVAEVALLAASASENTKSRRFPGNALGFTNRVNKLGWHDLPLVPMPGVYGLSYFDFAYFLADGVEFERQTDALWSVIAPNVKREPQEHLEAGQALDDGAIQSVSLSKWRNTWCDVISAYCHIVERRDVFVTNNTRDFQNKRAALARLGMSHIASPDEAAAML